MILHVLDRNLEIVNLIDNAQSVIWTTKFWEPGDFEIYMIANEKNLQTIQQGYFVVRDKLQTGTFMVIEKIEITTDVESGNYLKISGRSAECLLERRCHMSPGWSVFENANYPYAVFYELVNMCGGVSYLTNNYENNGLPFLTEERQLFMQFFTTKDYIEALRTAYPITTRYELNTTALQTNASWLETATETAKMYGFGFHFVPIFETGWNRYMVEVHVIVPVDRSVNQSANTPIVFSREYDNLVSSNYVYDKQNYKNCVFIYGEGEGTERICKRVWSGAKPEMLDLYEMFVDARDLSTKDDETTLTMAQYGELLDQRALAKLTENTATESFEGEILDGVQWQFGVDYNIGDIVTMQNEFNINRNVRVTAVTESEDDTGYYCIPIFENVEAK